MSAQQPSRASKLFTQAFTLKYPQIAQQHPVYAQLKTLIDLSIVAAYMQEHGSYESAGWSADILLDEFACNLSGSDNDILDNYPNMAM